MYTIGIDFGTNSCRAIVLDLKTGLEVGSAVFPFPSGDMGILTDPTDPDVARQHPGDYLDGLQVVVRDALADAGNNHPEFSSRNVIGIGVDTTGSTVLPIDEHCIPLALTDRFEGRLEGMAWLWKDHSSHEEAEEINQLAAEYRPHFLQICGGRYSSEWWWSKIVHLCRTAPEVFQAAYSFVELCDWIPAVLTGAQHPREIKRSVCAAGHKALFHESWGGLPDEEFLAMLDHAVGRLRDRLYNEAYPATEPAGTLCADWAKRLGLPENITIAVGAFDAHLGAVGAGIQPGTIVKIMGTSTCDIVVASGKDGEPVIPGVCGVVDGSVLPGYFGVEAGQSAVGDIFLWWITTCVPEAYGTTVDERFARMERAAAQLAPGETGLLALDWFNGNRSILTDARLTGLLIGLSLRTTPVDIYRALLEATAFGALAIIEQIEEAGAPIKEVVATGGLAVRSPLLMQIYADVLNRPIHVAGSDQTCALGAAMVAAVAAGQGTADELRDRCCRRSLAFTPRPTAHGVYHKLYGLYRDLHDAFGTPVQPGLLNYVMKTLLDLRDGVHGDVHRVSAADGAARKRKGALVGER